MPPPPSTKPIQSNSSARTPCHSRHQPLAELEVRADHLASKGDRRSTSTTTSTGTSARAAQGRLPARRLRADFATYEIPYGTIERPTTRNNSWEKAQFEVPAMRWADLSGAADGKVHGLSMINQLKYGYDAAGNVLRLRCCARPSGPIPTPTGPSPLPLRALSARRHVEGRAHRAPRLGVRLPAAGVVTTAHAGSLPAEHSFASVSPDNVVLTAVKKAEDANGLIFRVYEWAGKETTVEFHVPPGATGATVTNMMEQPEGDPLPVDRRCGQGADSSVRDSDDSRGLSVTAEFVRAKNRPPRRFLRG
jgi:hypothetical protein